MVERLPFDVLQLLVKFINDPNDRCQFRLSCRTFKYSIECSCLDNPKTSCNKSIAFNHQKCLEKSLHRNHIFDYNSLIISVKYNNFEAINTLRQFKCEENYLIAGYASSVGNLKTLMYLVNIGFDVDEYATGIAAKNGHFECLKFLLSIGCKIDYRASAWAGYNNHMEILEWLYYNNYPANKMMYNLSCASNNKYFIDFVNEHKEWWS
jgi:ankyrin repeat protein